MGIAASPNDAYMVLYQNIFPSLGFSLPFFCSKEVYDAKLCLNWDRHYFLLSSLLCFVFMRRSLRISKYP